MSCGEFNWAKRNQTADLRDKTVLLTGNSLFFLSWGVIFFPALTDAPNHCLCVHEMESSQPGPKLNTLFVSIGIVCSKYVM